MQEQLPRRKARKEVIVFLGVLCAFARKTLNMPYISSSGVPIEWQGI
jgi:uncharacterized membrane protein